MFFTCRTKSCGTLSAEWRKRVEYNVQREEFQKTIETGESVDKSAPAISIGEVELVSSAYAKAGSPEAAERGGTLNSLWWTGGRPGEVSKLPPLSLTVTS